MGSHIETTPRHRPLQHRRNLNPQTASPSNPIPVHLDHKEQLTQNNNNLWLVA